MPQVKEVARVTRSGRALPDVTKNELPVNAWLVWESAKNKALAAKNVERQQHQGEDGYLWHGAMTGIFRELWVGMLDSYTGDKNEVVTAKRQLSSYLNASHNMICVDRGQQSGLDGPSANNRPPTWWVRAEWNENPPPPKSNTVIPTYAERKLTPHEAGEDRPPAPVTVIQGEPKPPARPAPPPLATSVLKFGSNRDEQREVVIELLAEKFGSEPFTSRDASGHLGISDGSLYHLFTNMAEIRELVDAHLARAAAANEKKPIICPDCEQPFTDQRYYNQHRVAKHLTNEDGERDRPFKCPQCERTFAAQGGLTNHINSHRTAEVILRGAAALLESRGVVNNDELVAVCNGAISHFTSLYTHFSTKQDLIDKATELLHSEGRTVKRPNGIKEMKVTDLAGKSLDRAETSKRLLSIIAFAYKIGSPISITAARIMVNNASPEVRADALDHLLDSGALVVEQRAAASGRPFDALIPTSEVNLSLAREAVTVDPAAAVEALLADYRKLQEQGGQSAEAITAQQLARQAAEKRAAAVEAELTTLKEKLRNFSSLFEV